MKSIQIPFLYFMCVLVASFMCCSDEDFVAHVTDSSALKVSVVANVPQSKGLITTGFLPAGSKIGVALLNANEGDVGASNIYNHKNVMFTAVGENESQTWDSETDIFLTQVAGTAYAYYPYSDKVTDVAAIPVTTETQTDYLYAKHTDLSNSATTATFAMKHALSVVSLTVVKGSYSGTGTMTQAAVRGPGICTGGKMNAKVNADENPLHSLTGAAEQVAVNTDFNLSEVGEEVDLIVIPNVQTSAFRISLTIDGKVYTTSTSEIKLEPGCRYHFTVTADERQLSLSSVTIGDWGYSEAGSPSIMVGGYAVKLAGNLSGLAFSSVVSDGAVTIQARPKTGVWVPSSITATAGATLTSSVVGEGLITIQLSDFTDDVTVTIDGYAVSLAGDLDKLSFNNKVSEGAVTIVAQPVGELWVSTGVTITGGAIMNKSIADDGSITVNLSNITGNTTVTFTGFVVKFVGDREGMLIVSQVNANNTVKLHISVDKELLCYSPNELFVNGGSLLQRTFKNNRYLTLTSIESDITITFNGYSFSGWTNVEDGVYAISTDCEPVILENASSNCIGVALINSITSQRIMIEKFENANNTESISVYTSASQQLGSSDDAVFSWGGYGSNSGTFVSSNPGDGSNNSYGFLPDSNGKYPATPYLMGSLFTWIVSGGALSDFNGANNSVYLKTIVTNGSASSESAPMAILMNAFNDIDCPNSVNQGFTDWFIPSCGQLGLIWLNLPEINTMLSAIGGTELYADYYWSSTEYTDERGWYVFMANGYVYSYDKVFKSHVRLVRELI